MRLGGRRARLGLRELRAQALHAAGELAALGLGRLAAPAGGLGLAAQVVGARELALEALLARRYRPAILVGGAQAREQR